VEALGALGLARRWEFKGPLVGITGSSGKTTTRRILVSILAEKYKTHQPMRNFNNHIGVPLTLLRLKDEHEAAVLELGCSDFGEIAALTKCSEPDICLVTNVGPAHLERLGDLDGVAKAKGELFKWMQKDAVAVVNMDDPRIGDMPVNGKKRITYGTKRNLDVSLLEARSKGVLGQRIVLQVGEKRVAGTLPLIGKHNVLNALAAAAAATVVGLGLEEIVRGLEKVQTEPGRLEMKHTRSGALVIDDTYNANPASMRAALDTIVETVSGGKAVAVLGDMLELGDKFEESHTAIGKYVVQYEIDLLITLGKGGALIGHGALKNGFAPEKIVHVAYQEQAADLVEGRVGEGDVVLVKGSRGMQMDKVVTLLMGGDK
jgi:UDP-N-acetylmuramoyl-tripeptide--D-alanyl-D-alanine ligase